MGYEKDTGTLIVRVVDITIRAAVIDCDEWRTIRQTQGWTITAMAKRMGMTPREYVEEMERPGGVITMNKKIQSQLERLGVEFVIDENKKGQENNGVKL